MLSDLHTHTTYSVDGEADIYASCEKAVSLGLGAIAFTEHYDILPPGMHDPGYEPYFVDDRDYYIKNESHMLRDVEKARELYKDKLRVVYAVELGQPHFDPQAAHDFIKSRNFDFIIGSEHYDDEYHDFYSLDYSRVDIDRLFENYYRSNIVMLRRGGFDTLAHIDQPVRLMQGRIDDPDLHKYRDAAAEVLREAITRGIAVEINTHGLRNWYGRVTPAPWILKFYHDLGGRLVTIGSDAHRETDVGAGVSEASALADSLGLRRVLYYVNRKPVFSGDL